jgi:protein-L-isoaspartate O-methyltransferase
VVLDNSYANRVEGLFYSKSDEKFTVRALLDEMLGDRRFSSALDVGPGPGHISEPLARRSKHLTMVEKLPQFEELLKRQFENADVIINCINDAQLDKPFDLILCSHVLYYQPESVWLELTTKLHSMLNEGGELLLILNSDSGDWWRMVHQFWDELRPHIGFHYIPLSQFKKGLAAIGSVQTVPYRYQVWIDPGATWCNFVARQMLELKDEQVIADYRERFTALSGNFKQIDTSIVLDFRAEILRIKR